MRLDMVLDHAAAQVVVKLEAKESLESGILACRRNDLHPDIDVVTNRLGSFDQSIPA
jgi:hypothetical protein